MNKSKSIFSYLFFFITITGCAKEPSFGDKMLHRSENTEKLGKSWNEGNDMVKKGKKLKEKGVDQIEEGKESIETGKNNIKKANRMIEEGNKLMRESEKEYRQLFPKDPLY